MCIMNPGHDMGIKYDDEAMEKLNLHREIGASAFALWIVPGTIVLCDRPETIEVVGGKLVSLTWRDAAKGE